MCANLLSAEPAQAPPHHPGSAGAKRLQSNPGLVLGIGAALYALLFLDLLWRMLAKTDGQFVFPLDDTYITMALAKNFALHGSWSLPHSSFQSASSTPAFLLLLAGLYRITGPTVWTPLALSFLFGLLVIFLTYRMLRNAPPSVRFVALLSIVTLTPLPVLGLLGMEHTLHIALVLFFLPSVADVLAERAQPSWVLLLLTAVMVATRYESLFLVACGGLFFLAQRQFRAALALWIAGGAPVVVYAVVSVLHGCYWLPHSISLKGYVGNSGLSQTPTKLATHFYSCLIRAPYLGALLLIILVLLALTPVRRDQRVRAALGIVSGALVLHLFLADVGWVYRYEAYLVAASIAAIALAIGHVGPVRDKFATVVVAALCIIGASALAQRALDAEMSLPERSAAIYSQQIQMARFLGGLQPGLAVAANDVGAINFFADIQCMDLVGLADKDIFWLKRKRQYSTEALSELTAARHVKLAVLYDSWFQGNPYFVAGPPLPNSWLRLEEWATPYGQYVGSPVVTFYAVDVAEAPYFKQALEQFDTSLPKQVHVLRGTDCLRARPCM